MDCNVMYDVRKQIVSHVIGKYRISLN